MKTAPDCFTCFLRQAVRVARMTGCNEKTQTTVTKGVAALLAELDVEASPPANAISIYTTIMEITGCRDPYHEVKRLENRRALQVLPALREEVAAVPEPLLAAVRFAIAANIIDYGVATRFDTVGALALSRTAPFVVDHRDTLLAAVKGLPHGGSILYLADNCGEIVYDALVVELLAQQGYAVTVAVRDAPIINDALRDDAELAGLHRFARIISNGTASPGTPLAHCCMEFRELFDSADLVISKGQGNFESLSDVSREIFFLLTVKCKVVAEHLALRLGGEERLKGEGEMVVYHHRAGQMT